LDVVQLLYSGCGQITENVLFPHRTGEAVVEDIQPVGSSHCTASHDCITDCPVITITKSRDSGHGIRGARRSQWMCTQVVEAAQVEGSMSTATEVREPEVKKPVQVKRPPLVPPSLPVAARPLFSDCLLE